VLSRHFLEQLRKTAVFLSVRIDGVPAEIRTGYHYTNFLGPYLWDSTVYINNDLWCSENRRKSRKHVEDFDPSQRLSVNERYMRLVDPHQRRHSTVIVNTQHNCTSHWTRFLTLYWNTGTTQNLGVHPVWLYLLQSLNSLYGTQIPDARSR